MNNLTDQLEILKVLSQGRYNKDILKNADKKLISALCEIVYNVLENNINISESDLTKLSKYKKYLRKLVQRNSIKEKRKILVQKGGFLQIILPAVISGIASIVSGFISDEIRGQNSSS
jgi:hypothetical protein